MAGGNVVELVSRRSFIGGVTASGLLLAGSALRKQPAMAGTQNASQIHVEFGNDAAQEMTVSWSTPGSVNHPRVVLGTAHGGFGQTIPAETLTHTDAIDGVETYMQHARISGLRPATSYVYSVLSDGSAPVQGTFATAPVGRVPFRFTSFGDIGSGNPTWSKSSLNAITATAQIEQFNPVVHLLNTRWPPRPRRPRQPRRSARGTSCQSVNRLSTFRYEPHPEGC
jgi:phosphodiesterase/alkaline phosphatase D-like protein